MILLWSIVTHVPPTYGTVPFPAWGLALGWCMVAVVLVWIPAVAAYKLTREEGSFWKVCVCCLSQHMEPFIDVWWICVRVANVAALSAAIENTLLSQREMAPLPRC